jgi:hypothetical protein
MNPTLIGIIGIIVMVIVFMSRMPVACGLCHGHDWLYRLQHNDIR